MGNTCGSNGQGGSRAFSLSELVDLPIGGTKEMGNGCGPNISGTQGGSGYDWLSKKGFGWPNNGEFDWGGLGNSCAMCSDPLRGYGCDNCSGGNTVGGRRGSVKRIAYNADPAQCCIQGQQIIGNNTCDPVYLSYNNTQCDIPMLNYCKQGKWGSTECQSWVQAILNAGRTVANVDLSAYCSSGTNYNTTECQAWASAVRRQPAMRSASDASVTTYCSNNPSDPNCACMQPPSNVTAIENLMATSKACWYKPCQTLTNDNYITSTMLDQKNSCVNTTCVIDAGDITISGSGNTVQFDNQCASNLLKPGVDGSTNNGGTNGGTNNGGTNGGTNNGGTTGTTSNNILMGGVSSGLLCMCLILIIAILIIMLM